MEYLKLYKQQQKELFEETIQGYRKDKIIRLQEWNLKEQDFLESIKGLEDRLAEREIRREIVEERVREVEREGGKG